MQKLENNEPRPKFTGYYKKNLVSTKVAAESWYIYFTDEYLYTK